MKTVPLGCETQFRFSSSETEAWANRPGQLWPCSTVAGRSIWVTLDNLTGDLVDTNAGDEIEWRELRAMLTDFGVPVS